METTCFYPSEHKNVCCHLVKLLTYVLILMQDLCDGQNSVLINYNSHHIKLSSQGNLSFSLPRMPSYGIGIAED